MPRWDKSASASRFHYALLLCAPLLMTSSVTMAWTETDVPACPAGSRSTHWQTEGSPYIQYRCELLEKSDNMEMCREWEGTRWSTTAAVPCGSRVSFTVSYTGPLKCPVSQQVYLGSVSSGIKCLPTGWVALPFNGSSCPTGFVHGATAVRPTEACYGPEPSEHAQDLAAHDINGFRLDMTFKQVQELAGVPLSHLGGNDFDVTVKGIDYGFGFSVLGHLYRIDSKQPLGRFIPDATYGRMLTEKLTEKFGPPQTNQLPGGPAFWQFVEPYNAGNGVTANRITVSLSAMLMSGWNQPVALQLKLMDFRIMRRDVAIANTEPRSRAEKATQF